MPMSHRLGKRAGFQWSRLKSPLKGSVLNLILLGVTTVSLLSLISAAVHLKWQLRGSSSLPFHYLRPTWRTVDEFLRYCSDFDGSEGGLVLDPELSALRPLFASPTFAEASRALEKYHQIIARRRRKTRNQGKRVKRTRGNHHQSSGRRDPSKLGSLSLEMGVNSSCYTCIPWEQSASSLISVRQPHRIAVLSIATGPYEDIYDRRRAEREEQLAYESARNASLADRQRYCERHGYICHVSQQVVKGRAAGWYRLPAILALLGQHKYDWVFHIDLDAVILDHTVKLEEFLDPRYDLITGVDQNGINNGIFFLRNSTWSRLFYAECWTRTHEQFSQYWAEQAAMSAILQENIGAQNRVKLMPHAYFNNYLPEGEDDLPSSTLRTFILHFAGRKDKWALVKKFISRNNT